jgi:hypothetical protein
MSIDCAEDLGRGAVGPPPDGGSTAFAPTLDSVVMGTEPAGGASAAFGAEVEGSVRTMAGVIALADDAGSVVTCCPVL